MEFPKVLMLFYAGVNIGRAVQPPCKMLRMPSGGTRPGAGRKPVPEKRVRLTAYVTPRTMKVLAGMSEDLNRPIGQVLDYLTKGGGD